MSCFADISRLYYGFKIDPSRCHIFYAYKWHVQTSGLDISSIWPEIINVFQLKELISTTQQERAQKIIIPQDLNRVLCNTVEPNILHERLVVKLGNYRVEADFYFRDLTQVVLELYTSKQNHLGGPIYSMDFVYCEANRQFGKRFQKFLSLIKTQKRKVNFEQDIVLLLQFYSDSTTTSFATLHPLMVRLANQDNDACTLNLKSSFRNVAMFPVDTSYDCFLNEDKITLAELKESYKIGDIKGQILRKALEVIKQQLRILEEGVKVNVDNKERLLFAFLFSYVSDMEERSQILHLFPSSFYHCCHCYLYHPQKSNEQKLAIFQTIDEILGRNLYQNSLQFSFDDENDDIDEFITRTIQKDPEQALNLAFYLEDIANNPKNSSLKRNSLLHRAQILRMKYGEPRNSSNG